MTPQVIVEVISGDGQIPAELKRGSALPHGQLMPYASILFIIYLLPHFFVFFLYFGALC